MIHTTSQIPGGGGQYPPPGAPGARHTPRHTNPSNITDGNSPASRVSNGEFEAGSAERETGPEVSSLHSGMDTVREQLRQVLKAVRAYVTPPSLFTDTPASLAELAAYARWGGWTSSTEGLLRNLGIGWYRLVGLPVTAVCRYVEWIAQRPGRAIPVFLLWKLCLHTGGGPWLLDHVIHPVLGLTAWVLL